MKKLKKYGVYVLGKDLESYVLWFETEKERDKVFDKIKSDVIVRKEKRKRQWYGI
jgi:hypothetical protein